MSAHPPLFGQIARFIVTGGINTVFGYLVYALGVTVLKMSYTEAVTFSYVIGVSFSYIMFRTFVFTGGDRSWRSFSRFIPTYVVLLFINMAALAVLVDHLGMNKLLAQAIIVPFCAALSFIINRLFIFKTRPAKET